MWVRSFLNVSMSFNAGTFVKVNSPPQRSVVAMRGRAEFLAPLTSTVPMSLLPPSITSLSIVLSFLFPGLSLQRLGLVKGYEVIGEFLKIPVHYLGKPVEGKPYPVVRDPVLGKVIGAYLLRPVAGAYLHLPFGRDFFILLARLFVEKAA